MIDRLEQMEQRYDELSAQLGLPEVITDHEKYQKAGRALREIEPAVEKFRELKQVREGLAGARAMLAETDADMRAMAQEEIVALEPREAELEEEIKVLLLPKFSACTRATLRPSAGRWRYSPLPSRRPAG